MNPYKTLFEDALRQPLTAISYTVSQQLTALFPEKALLEGDACSFDLQEFIDDGLCEAKPKPDTPYNQIATSWYRAEEGIERSLENIWFEVTWQGHTLDVLHMEWPQTYSSASHFWILADTTEIAEAFFVAVRAWNTEVRGEVLVFEAGGWDKNSDLYEAIQNSRLENLVLAGTLKQEIADDVARFFASREQYQRYGVPWKRGILFLGPPGNGKTHCVKALLNASRLPCLYVKSFKSQHNTDEENIRSVFQRARRTTPCLLVMEDLDSLIDSYNRAYFLNEMDGFASNAGIVVLATTNHPERLDPAIVDRPSRFDRKYHFELPAAHERATYIRQWNTGLQPELQLTETGIAAIAEQTEAFSFAYLKELFLSGIMQWMSASENTMQNMETVLVSQVELLKTQMATMETESVGNEFPGDDDARNAALLMRRYRNPNRRR